jgi:hypothetical protein
MPEYSSFEAHSAWHPTKAGEACLKCFAYRSRRGSPQTQKEDRVKLKNFFPVGFDRKGPVKRLGLLSCEFFMFLKSGGGFADLPKIIFTAIKKKNQEKGGT